MKRCGTLLFFFFFAFALCGTLSAQQGSSESLPTSGELKGNVYRNNFFGFNYFIPEGWAARGKGGKLPGATNGYLLLPLKRQSGDPLALINLSAVDLSNSGGDVKQFLQERHRLRRETADQSDTVINGIRVSRGRPKTQEIEPELLVIGQRNFYRMAEESSGVTRVTVATSEKGYALVFELIAPDSVVDDMQARFADSLHGLDFAVSTATSNK